MAEYQLYCFAQSGNSYKVALMLALIGARWKPIHVDFFHGETRSPEYRQNVNEMGEVPVLVEGARKISQSGAILTGPGTYTIITRDPFKKQRWVKIGSTAEMTIAEARELARHVIRRIEQGLDAFEAPPVKVDSVAAVAEAWMKRHVMARSLRTGDQYRHTLDVHILPHWGDRSFAGIKRSDIARLCDAVEDQRGAWVADVVLGTLRAIASWYASRNDDYTPPFVKRMRRVPEEARKRTRVLDDDEIRKVWTAAESFGSYGALIRLLLVTGQRRQKILEMRWPDIAEDSTWSIPTAPREKGNPRHIKLPKLALEIVHTQPRFVGNDHVLAGAGSGPFGNFTKLKAKFDQACGVTGWKLHDLRHTARSLMSRAKVRPDIAEIVLGHVIPGVRGIYDRHAYSTEKADALTRLAALLEQILDPPADNVVSMVRT
jgi:integrase